MIQYQTNQGMQQSPPPKLKVTEIEKGLVFKLLLEKCKFDQKNTQGTNYSTELERIQDQFYGQKCNFSKFYHNNAQQDMIWQIEFQPESGDYIGKKIVGLLIFPNDYPLSRPKFFLGHFKNDEYFKHLNTYNGGEMCIPLLTKEAAPSLDEIINAIFKIFCYPNDGDAANIVYKSQSDLQRQIIITKQRSLLEDWIDE